MTYWIGSYVRTEIFSICHTSINLISSSPFEDFFFSVEYKVKSYRFELIPDSLSHDIHPRNDIYYCKLIAQWLSLPICIYRRKKKSQTIWVKKIEHKNAYSFERMWPAVNMEMWWKIISLCLYFSICMKLSIYSAINDLCSSLSKRRFILSIASTASALQ